MKDAAGTPLGSPIFDDVKIGAGGYLTGLDVADDGTVVYRCDTHGAGILEPGSTEWRQLMRAGITFPANQVEQYDGNDSGNSSTGTYDTAICATNSDIIYLVCMGWVWKSTDYGLTFAHAGLQLPVGHGANLPDRYSRKRLAIHPTNSDIVMLGSLQGLRYTTNGGTSWTLVSTASIPAPVSTGEGSAGMAVAFDRDTPTTVYVFSSGAGIYRSTTGPGGTFSLIASSPTQCADMQVQRTTGKLFVCGTVRGNDATLQSWNGTSWTDHGLTAKSLALDPNDSNRVFALSSGSNVSGSANGGASFGGYGATLTRVNNEIPWHVWTDEIFMSNGGSVYHPTEDKILLAEGIGYWECSNPSTSGGSPTWVGKSAGIENMVGVQGTVDPNGRFHVAIHDRSHFVFERDGTDQYQATHGPAPESATGAAIQHSNRIDFAIDDPDFVVMASNNHGYYSTDGGQEWTRMTAQPPELASLAAQCGEMVIGNSDGAILWLPASQCRPYYTLDLGETWEPVSLGATADAFLDAGGTIGGYHAYYVCRQSILADKLNPGHFYLYLVGDGSGSAGDLATKGIWKSTDNCVTWTRIRSTLITLWVLDFWNVKLKQVPGKAGHFFYTVGQVGVAGDAQATTNLWYSTDYMATWTEITPSPNEIRSFSFGKAAGSHDYPAIYASGEVGGGGDGGGIFKCLDFNPAAPGSSTWTLVEQFPNGRFDEVNDVAGDMNVFGLYYLIFGGIGAMRARNVHTLRFS